MPYETGPSENTLTVNTTHQMLRHFEGLSSGSYRHLVAFSPTRKWENLTGYDVSLPFLKTTVFQYKRPRVPDNSTPRSNQRRRFQLDQDQWLTLLLLFDTGEAFFTLPNVMTKSQLAKSRDRTVFVDVYGLLPNTSLAYVEPDTVRSGKARDFLLGKINKGPKYPVHPEHVYGWREICDGIDECTVGVRFGTPNERTEEFEAFDERIDRVANLEEESWRRDRLSRILRNQQEEYVDFYAEVRDLYDESPQDRIYGVDPAESRTWQDVSNMVPSNLNDDRIGAEISSLIKEDWTMDFIGEQIRTLRDEETDPSTYRLKRTKINVFGQ